MSELSAQQSVGITCLKSIGILSGTIIDKEL